MPDPLVKIVGGVYDEECLHPKWQEYFGSGGRAASAIASMGASAQLHTYLDPTGTDVLRDRAKIEGFEFVANSRDAPITFHYHHPLEAPRIVGVPSKPQPALRVQGDAVVQFGMLEADAVISANRAVYDPQNADNPQHFGANGSVANELALVLNRREARQLSGMSISATAEEMADKLLRTTGTQVIVIKEGPLGAYVHDGNAGARVPAYRSRRVWKIGSGDNFVAHFAYQWLVKRLPPEQCVQLASRATAYY